MSFSCEDDQYRIFLCYRRKEQKAEFAPSEDVAGILHWWLNYSSYFSAKNPAFFEECYKTGGPFTFGQKGIEQFMPQMTTCFVVLCPGFFDKMLAAFQVAMARKWSTREELLKITRELLCDKNLGDVCYLELKHALTRNGRVKPILVTAGGKHPFDDLNKTLLAEILGETSHQLFEAINPCTVDYDQLAPFMKDVQWKTIKEEDAKARMELLEKSKEGAALLEALQQMLQQTGAPEEKDIVDTVSLLADLQRCARTFLSLQKPSGDDCYFYAGNPTVIYDPLRSCNMKNDPRVKPPFLAACLVDSFRENKKAFGLQMDNFSYWDVNLDLAVTAPQEQQSIPLSVCAVCFGILSVHHYMTKEWERLHEAPLMKNTTNPMLKTIRSGQNLLLALRNPYTKTWPSSWEFNYADAQTLGTEGTTNQTNLSLATLMSCGFLDSDIPAKYLKPRYEYIWESVEVLLGWGVTRSYDRKVTGWRYTPVSRYAPALLPTVFVFDTLCKLKHNISNLISVFTEDEAFCARLQQNLLTVENKLTEILAFIAEKQCVIGGEPIGAFRRFERTEFSVTHTAYVTKSLCQYIQDYGDENGELQKILTPAIHYLVNEVEAMKQNGNFRFKDFELYEDFCDSENDVRDDDGLKSTYGEKYEHCAEFIIGEALIKIAEYTKDSALCSQVMDQLGWLFNKCTKEKRVIGKDGDTIRIKGIRDFLPYPIYSLYYYRMFLWDYLLLLEKKEA